MASRWLSALLLLAGLTGAAQAVTVSSLPKDAVGATFVDPLSVGTLKRLKVLYKQLIDAENRHDLATVKSLVWVSPAALFVAKTATPEEGNWAGFWGSDVVLQHLGDLFRSGPFAIKPDYAREKVVGITSEVAETYVPVDIAVAYAGQTPVPKPFLMILEWVHTPDGWRMATDIALPIPPSPKN